MSGGEYDYAYSKLEQFSPSLKGGCYAAPPAMRKAFVDHCAKVAEIMKAIEWNDSGDGDDTEEEKIRALLTPKELDLAAQALLRNCAEHLAYMAQYVLDNIPKEEAM